MERSIPHGFWWTWMDLARRFYRGRLFDKQTSLKDQTGIIIRKLLMYNMLDRESKARSTRSQYDCAWPWVGAGLAGVIDTLQCRTVGLQWNWWRRRYRTEKRYKSKISEWILIESVKLVDIFLVTAKDVLRWKFRYWLDMWDRGNDSDWRSTGVKIVAIPPKKIKIK